MNNPPNSTCVQPYLMFNGRCEEALEFYRDTVGATVRMKMRFNEMPEPQQMEMAPGLGEKIMHAEFVVGTSTIMASDGDCQSGGSFDGFSLALTVHTEAEADRVFEGLANGGQVRMPLGKTFFSQRFGMVADRFGVGWMIMVPPAQA
jgi:PhnB protein